MPSTEEDPPPPKSRGGDGISAHSSHIHPRFRSVGRAMHAICTGTATVCNVLPFVLSPESLLFGHVIYSVTRL